MICAFCILHFTKTLDLGLLFLILVMIIIMKYYMIVVCALSFTRVLLCSCSCVPALVFLAYRDAEYIRSTVATFLLYGLYLKHVEYGLTPLFLILGNIPGHTALDGNKRYFSHFSTLSPN